MAEALNLSELVNKGPSSAGGDKPCLHFMTNGIFSTSVAGGDLHCFELARAAIAAGYPVTFWGGHVLQSVLKAHDVPAELVLTDRSGMAKPNVSALKGQWALFNDFRGRYAGTLRQLRMIQPDDLAYAVSDYWFDVLPVVRCPARSKLMVWHMQAPSFSQILRRSRPDVDPLRLASLHYWASQNLSLRSFRRCALKRLFHVHPAMRERLLAMGYLESEIKYMSFGMEPMLPSGSEADKQYDICWIGRVHRQKGIEDLLGTLAFLSHEIRDFRAILIGNVKNELEPRIRDLGIDRQVEFSGFVSEVEKFRLFRASRVFLMPSKFEGSPRVVGEALLCRLPVVAYDVPTYRPIFGDLLRYVPCFNQSVFQQYALDQIRLTRSGFNYLANHNLAQFIAENSWATLRRRFLDTVEELVEMPQ